MADRDLTPAAATHDTPYGASEARAEVEAFMGEGFRCIVTQAITRTAQPCHRFRVCAVRSGITNQATGPTYRAAVDALKAAWRDAVRPWMEAAIEAKLDTADVDGYAPNERVIDRVCEKGMENV